MISYRIQAILVVLTIPLVWFPNVYAQIGVTGVLVGTALHYIAHDRGELDHENTEKVSG